MFSPWERTDRPEPATNICPICQRAGDTVLYDGGTRLCPSGHYYFQMNGYLFQGKFPSGRLLGKASKQNNLLATMRTLFTQERLPW